VGKNPQELIEVTLKKAFTPKIIEKKFERGKENRQKFGKPGKHPNQKF